ncbi:MAG: ABC transporter permease [Flavobacteriales bacterium]
MQNYIIRKLLYGILVLFGVVTVVFVLFFFKPGDPARMMGGQHASPETIEAINKELGLNLPFHKQYLLYLNDLSPISIHNRKDEDSYIYLWDNMPSEKTERKGASFDPEKLEKNTPTRNSKKSYERLIAQADSLFKDEWYDRAAEKYRTALAIFPDKTYPENRINRIQKLKKYTHLTLLRLGEEKVLVLKFPYLRRSYQSQQLVSTIIINRLPGTILLASTSIILATILGVLLGVTAAIRKGSFLDNFCLTFSVLGMSGPSYFTGLIIAFLFGSKWSDVTNFPILPFVFLGGGLLIGALLDPRLSKDPNRQSISIGHSLKRGLQAFGVGLGVWLLGISINGMFQGSPVPFLNFYLQLPGTGLSASGSMYEYYLDHKELALHNLILPSIALGMRPLAVVVQLTRSSMLDVLSQDYIRTATAKGISRYRLILKHALKNAMNPVITAISGWFALMMAGAIFIEHIFAWRGLGWEVFEALRKDDMPVVMGVVLVIAFMFVLINILVDIIYGYLDPRVRMQ